MASNNKWKENLALEKKITEPLLNPKITQSLNLSNFANST